MECIKNYLNYKVGDTVSIIRFGISNYMIDDSDVISSDDLYIYFK